MAIDQPSSCIYYRPSPELSIDEMMIGTRCRISFLQYMAVQVSQIDECELRILSCYSAKEAAFMTIVMISMKRMLEAGTVTVVFSTGPSI